MDLTDIFIIAKLSPKTIWSFLQKQLDGFSSKDENHEYPKYAGDTIFETASLEEMLQFVLQEPGRSYTFYLANQSGKLYPQAIIQINADNSMCLGIAALEENVDECVALMAGIFPDQEICISNNVPLPGSLDNG